MDNMNHTGEERGKNVDDMTGKGAEQWRTI